MILAFGPFTIACDTFELRRDEERIPVEPQVFDLLVYLAKNPDRVINRDELLREVWKDRIVSDSTVATAIKFARKALGDTGATQSYIQTVRGRGFRFVAEVKTETEEAIATQSDTSGLEQAARSSFATSGSGELRLALLPLQVLTSDDELQFFADGLLEDLTTNLARVPELTVISKSSTVAYRDKSPTIEQVRDELRVTHIVTGSLRAHGRASRISLQLVDTQAQSELWAGRFDRSLEDLFAVQDEVTESVSRILVPKLVRASLIRTQRPEYLRDAHQLYQRASGILALKGWHPESFTESTDLLQAAIDVDPAFARAYSLLSLTLGLGQRVGMISDREEAVTHSHAAIDRALELDNSDPVVLGHTGCALADIGEPERGLGLLQRAVELDPSNAQAWAALGATKTALRRAAEGIADMRHGIDISPLDNRLSVWGSFLALAFLMTGDVNAAREEADIACRRDSRNHMPHVIRAAIALREKNRGVAEQAIARAYELRPALSADEVRALVGRSLARNGLLRDQE